MPAVGVTGDLADLSVSWLDIVGEFVGEGEVGFAGACKSAVAAGPEMNVGPEAGARHWFVAGRLPVGASGQTAVLVVEEHSGSDIVCRSAIGPGEERARGPGLIGRGSGATRTVGDPPEEVCLARRSTAAAVRSWAVGHSRAPDIADKTVEDSMAAPVFVRNHRAVAWLEPAWWAPPAAWGTDLVLA